MQTPLQITFRNIETSEAVENRIRERAGRLERFSNDIIGCRAVVEVPHRSPGSGKHALALGLEVDVPGKTLVAKGEAAPSETRDLAGRMIGDVFDAMLRQLEDYHQIRRRDVNRPQGGTASQVGSVVRLYKEQDYGFIEVKDGPTLYFHRSVVHADGFDRLTLGTSVAYAIAAQEGPMGPQASQVRPLGEAHAGG